MLIDGEKTVADSQVIAEYLEAEYPDAPSLFGGAQGHALTQFVPALGGGGVAGLAGENPGAGRCYKMIHPKDQPYFRESREPRLGASIEALGAQREQHLPAFLAAAADAAGDAKGPEIFGRRYAALCRPDDRLSGRCNGGLSTSSTPLLEAGDGVAMWMQAVLDYYGEGRGLANATGLKGRWIAFA